MNRPFSLNQARNQYQSLELSSRLESASPHGLVAILYEELQRSFDVMMAAADRGKTLSGEPATARARSILIALEGSLDAERGGDVARTLGGIYRAMQAEFSQAIAQNSREKLSALREGVAAIADSWNRIVQ